MPDLGDPTLEMLFEAARRAARRAYAPYSNFRVGSALRLKDGTIVTGVNVENASYGMTICAERSALVRAITEHGPGIRVVAVAIANLNDAVCPPCGACRQMLSEFAEPDAAVVFQGPDGMRVMPFAEVFPLVFELKPDREL
jgi:cytidine deaminase